MARINNENKGNEIIPRNLIFDNSLSDRARFVYCYMSAKPEGWDFVLAPMAAELNYSVDTLRKYLRELVDSGWITKGEQKKMDGAKFGSFEYTINNKPYRKKPVTEKNRDGKIPTQDNSSNINITPTQDNNSTVNSPINKEKISVSNETQKGVGDEVQASFEYFWKKYGKVGQKQQALKEWVKMTQKERETCMSRLDEYLTYCNLSKRKIKDASSYLHQKCYLEDWDGQVPQEYRTDEGATDVVSRFKRYMVKKYRKLIFHRYPLTYDQFKEKLDGGHEVAELERALDMLCRRDVDHYQSILDGLEAMLKSDEFLDVA